MCAKIVTYPVIIKEIYLDTFGHMNNAMYLILFEEARWEWLTQTGYGLNKIKETGLGPTILEINLRFLKELRVRDEVVIESQLISYEKKIAKMTQKMIRNGEDCCRVDITFGLFSVAERKLVMPTPDWLHVFGID